jgi:hypothetical protein
MGDDRAGRLVDVEPTIDGSANPKARCTEDDVSGRFG